VQPGTGRDKFSAPVTPPLAQSTALIELFGNIVRRMTHLRRERPSRVHTHELYNLQMRITLRNGSRFFSAMCLCLLAQSYFIAPLWSAENVL
jgi:hypothetical protein